MAIEIFLVELIKSIKKEVDCNDSLLDSELLKDFSWQDIDAVGNTDSTQLIHSAHCRN